MPFCANITKARLQGRFFMLTADAMERLSPGEARVYLDPETDDFVLGKVARLSNQRQGKVQGARLFNGDATSGLPLPFELGDVLEYDINGGEIRLMEIHRGEKMEEAGAPRPSSQPSSDSAKLPPAPLCGIEPPQLPSGATSEDVLVALVRWIQEDPFQRQRRWGGVLRPVDDATTGRGWDFRIQEYAYAKKSYSCYSQVYADTAPHIEALRKAIDAVGDWTNLAEETDLDDSDRKILEREAKWICEDWGGVPQRAGYADTWRVIRSAVTGVDDIDAPMSSGWTKVASFATDGRENGQTIWDSRVATSITWRIDRILQANELPQETVRDLTLGTIAAQGSGTRPREMCFDWPNGYGKWAYHFGGSEVVRRIVEILNDQEHGFPRMPRPTGEESEWDLFGVGLVLFMDGY